MTTLAAKCSLSERAVQGAVHGLERAGFVRREFRNGRSTVYWISFTPAESAPLHVVHPRTTFTPTPAADAPLPPHVVHPTPARRAPITVIEPSLEPKRREIAPAATRASKRCPSDFLPTDPQAWIDANVPGIDWQRETETFMDWTFAAAKTDWQATWRNWMRKASGYSGRGAAAKSFRQTDLDSAAERVREMTGGRVSAGRVRQPEVLQEIFDVTPKRLG